MRSTTARIAAADDLPAVAPNEDQTMSLQVKAVSDVLIRLLAIGLACCAMTGCSKNAQSGQTDKGKIPGSVPAARSVCNPPILKPADVAGLLSAPVTDTRPVPGDPQSCEFTTASFPAIIVSVRPGLGRSTVDAWATGKMPLETRPLAAVGDSAVWQETLHEVIARKNDLLCDIQVRSGGSDLAIGTDVLPAAVGALCTRIFAAY